MKRIKHSFGSYKYKDGTTRINITKVAEELAKGCSEIPNKISDRRAMEIYTLAVAYLQLEKDRGKNEKS
jgi:hypothetical protein